MAADLEGNKAVAHDIFGTLAGLTQCSMICNRKFIYYTLVFNFEYILNVVIPFL
jgi:hypothetical protein